MAVTEESIRKAKRIIEMRKDSFAPKSCLIGAVMKLDTFYKVLDQHPDLADAWHKAGDEIAITAAREIRERKDAKALCMLISRTMSKHYGKHKEESIKLRLPKKLRDQMLSEVNDGVAKMRMLLQSLLCDEITDWQFKAAGSAVKAAHPEQKEEMDAMCANVQITIPDNGRIKKNA